MFTRVPIFALLSFCAALLTLYDRFLSWAVITVIGRVPLCMSSTGTVKRQGLLNVLRQVPTHPLHSTGAESGPLTTIHNLRIINCMVNYSSERLTTVFLALADPTRRAILERLAHGEASGTELARPFSISVPAISKHLRVLEHADLILHRKDGRTHRFRLAARPLKEAATWLEHYRQFWEAQFDSLDTYLLATAEEEQDIDDLSSTS